MERRTFLGGLTAASFGVMLENSFSDPAQAQTGVSLGRQDSFETSQVEVSGNTIFVRRYGNGPAILIVHGFPRTSLMWRFLAPKLADNHTVICVDLPLRSQWNTRFRRRSLPLFQARNGKGTG
jgi:haloacetate dehalogenase